MVFQLIKGKKTKDLEKRFTTFSEQLAQAFAQIKTDISEVNHKVESNHKEMERMYQWVEYLNRSNQRLSEHHSKIIQKHDKIAENHQKLHTSHSELRLEHAQTARLAENLENKHQELSSAILAHKSALKNEVDTKINEHKDAYSQELERLKTWVDYLSAHLDRQKAKEDDLKQDITKVQKGWLEAYSQLRELVNGIQGENSELKTSIYSVREALISTRNDLESAKSELENSKNLAQSKAFEVKSELSAQIEVLREMQKQVQKTPQPAPQPQQIQPAQQIQPIIQNVSPTSTTFQRHIMARVMPNRKGYVLKFIMNLVRENKYSTKEIEETVVNDKQLCGRTSFYAYLKELKLKGRINYAEIDERQILVSTDTQQTLMSGSISSSIDDRADD